MFDKKYKKVLKMLDERIAFASEMHETYLHLNDGIERTDEDIRHDLLYRGGQWAKVDQYQAQLDVLCELRRQIRKELGP